MGNEPGGKFQGQSFYRRCCPRLKIKNTPRNIFKQVFEKPPCLLFCSLCIYSTVTHCPSFCQWELENGLGWQGLQAQGPALPWWVRPLCRGGGLLAKAGAWDEMSSSLGPGPAGVAFTPPVPVPDYRKLTSPCP